MNIKLWKNRGNGSSSGCFDLKIKRIKSGDWKREVNGLLISNFKTLCLLGGGKELHEEENHLCVLRIIEPLINPYYYD